NPLSRVLNCRRRPLRPRRRDLGPGIAGHARPAKEAFRDMKAHHRTYSGRQQQQYRTGERILLDAESTLEVQEGVVALTVIHDDGAEVLLGLFGPGQVLAGHHEDTCCIQLYAHTEARVRILPWPESAELPAFPDRLRYRLRHMEAWAAMQARSDR